MFHRLNDKGDNWLTEIPGCPEKRIFQCKSHLHRVTIRVAPILSTGTCDRHIRRTAVDTLRLLEIGYKQFSSTSTEYDDPSVSVTGIFLLSQEHAQRDQIYENKL
jgi:hypothetical protein